MLDSIGNNIAKILIAITVFTLAIILFQYMFLGSIDLSTALEKIFLQFIPTEVNIIELFAPVPIIMIIALVLFIKYVKPHM